MAIDGFIPGDVGQDDDPLDNKDYHNFDLHQDEKIQHPKTRAFTANVEKSPYTGSQICWMYNLKD